MNAKERAKILIIDDHPVVRQGLHQLINSDATLSVCGEADNAADCISLMGKCLPDLILTDISLSGTDGIELTKEARQINPNIPILVFSIHGEDLYAERALAAGASGYVMKQENPDILLHAIHKVLSGEIFLSTEMTNRMLRKMSGRRTSSNQTPATGINTLSDRELEVFELIGHGLSTRRIAEKLYLSIKTIGTYRMHIKDKLELLDASELTHHAVHWIEVESVEQSPAAHRPRLCQRLGGVSISVCERSGTSPPKINQFVQSRLQRFTCVMIFLPFLTVYFPSRSTTEPTQASIFRPLMLPKLARISMFLTLWPLDSCTM